MIEGAAISKGPLASSFKNNNLIVEESKQEQAKLPLNTELTLLYSSKVNRCIHLNSIQSLETLHIAPWGSSLLLDQKGKLYQWNYSRFDNCSPEEIKAEVDGKNLPRLQNIGCSAQHVFLATESGEVIVGNVSGEKSKGSKEEGYQELFQESKMTQKFSPEQKLHYNFFKLRSMQSHFISQICCGESHAIFVTSSGFIYSFGKNNLGQLGQQKTSILNNQSTSNEIQEPAIIFQLLNLKVFSVACGKNHTIAIGTSRDTTAQNFQIYSSDNALFTTIDKNKTLVYVWGDNSHGQLGVNDLPPLNDSNENSLIKEMSETNYIASPTFLDSLLDLNFRKAACGNNHTVLLEENGNLVAFGSNEYGQLGIPASCGQDQRAPEIVVFPQSKNQVEEGSSENNQGIQVFVNEILCNQDSTACVTDENEIYQWGKDIEKGEIQHEEPHLVSRIENIEKFNNPIVMKMFILPQTGFLLQAKDNPNQAAAQLDHSLISIQAPLQSSIDNSNYKSVQQPGYLPPSNTLLPTKGYSGISFTKEFENLLQYIAVTAGNTRMPAGLKQMTFRPGNLPPKSQEEEAKHQRLVEENRKQYLQKIRDKERQQQAQKQEIEKKEKRQQQLIAIWEGELLPNWDQIKRTKRVRELWIEGLPYEVRGRVWLNAFGNRNAITKELYYIKSDQGRKLRKLLKEIADLEQEIVENGGESQTKRSLIAQSPERLNQSVSDIKIRIEQSSEKERPALSQSKQEMLQNPKIIELSKRFEKLKKKLDFLIGFDINPPQTTLQNRERSVRLIEADIPRTFPVLKTFIQGTESYEKLQRMLEAFTMHRPDIGYVQGMSYIAAVLLIYMDEHQAFVTFCNLITKYPIMPFFSFNDGQVKKILQVFKQVLQHNLPDLCEHLETENILPKQYVYEWFMTMFSRALNLNLVSRVWDFYFLDGIFVLFQTAIAILRTLQEDLLREDFEGILGLLKSVPEIITNEEQFVSYIYDVSFPKWIYDEIPQMEAEYLKLI